MYSGSDGLILDDQIKEIREHRLSKYKIACGVEIRSRISRISFSRRALHRNLTVIAAGSRGSAGLLELDLRGYLVVVVLEYRALVRSFDDM